MQFTIIGLDGTDKDASMRRQAVRQDHIAMGDTLLKNRNLFYGAALLHADGTMKGSLYVVNFEDEGKFNDYLKEEPYMTGDVWRDVSVHKSNTRDPWQFNHTEDWYKENTF